MSGRSMIFVALMSAIVIILVEVLSWGAGKLLTQQGVFYVPEVVEGYEDYLLRRDPVLGWPPPDEFGGAEYDVTGSRVIPSFPDPRASCVSLYGDSFTWAAEVSHEEAWSNVLSMALGCRVANYGVEGYGSDQAYLRFRENRSDRSAVVILGHLSENIMRNVNQLRGTLYQGSTLGLKPRFILDRNGELELIAIPELTKSEYELVVMRPEQTLTHEFFRPNGPSGAQRLSFPYVLSVLRAFRHFHVIADLKGEPWYTQFYQPNHPAGGLALTARILEQFDEDARERGLEPLLLIIPTGLDLMYFAEHRRWVYSELIVELHNRGLSPLNVGVGIMDALGDRDPCELFSRCSSHFNSEGYALLAKLVRTRIEADNLLDGVGIRPAAVRAIPERATTEFRIEAGISSSAH